MRISAGATGMLALAVLLAAPELLHAQGKPPASWIGIAGEAPFVMPADRDAVALPLLVSLDAAVAAKDVKMELLGVRYEKLVDERITAVFSVDPSLERGAGRGPAILVNVGDVAALRPGQYQLTLSAKPGKDGTAQQLAVIVERPGVALAPLGKVSLDVLYGFPILGARTPSVYPSQLRFTPTPESKFSRIARVEPFVGPFKSGPGTPAGGTLEVAALTPVAAGQPLVVTLTPKGFPAGISTGSLEISGPDLKAPQSVELEIRARYSSAWVVVLIVAGLALGYVSRVALQRRIELARARAASFGVIEALEKELDRTKDHAFTVEVRAALQEVREALGGRDPKVIDEKAKAANAALEQATKALQASIKAVQDRLETLRVIVAWTEGLSPELSDALRKAADACVRHAEHLTRLDPSRAKSGLDATEPELVSDVGTGFARWRTLAPVRLDEVDRLRFALDKSAADALAAATAALRGSIETAVPPTDLSSIGAALARVREVNAHTAARLDWLGGEMQRDLKDFEALFIDRYGATDAILTQLGIHLGDLRGQLSAAAQRIDPSKPMYEAETQRAALADFEKLIDILVAKYKGTLNQSECDAVDAARKQQRFFEAVRALPARASRLKGGAHLAAGREVGEPRVRMTGQPVARPFEPAPSLATAPLAALKARTFGELARAEGVQTAIAAVLITGLGYVLFADKFVGTLSDIATVFLWGFTLDISVSKLVEMAAPLTAKARP